MNPRFLSLFIGLATIAFAGSCKPPGRPTSADIVPKPAEVRDFVAIYNLNCAGCHGAEGKGNAALGLANPVYLAIASDETIRHAIASGIRGSLMPAFARSAGGTLTDAQIEILVHQIRVRWAKPGEMAGASPPPYSTEEPGDKERGAGSFATYCAGCHGPDGQGTARGSSIVDGSFLALVSDQDLRTTIIAGRPNLGHPDWRHDVPGREMTSQDVTDVVAWLAAQRTATPGQPYAKNN